MSGVVGVLESGTDGTLDSGVAGDPPPPGAGASGTETSGTLAPPPEGDDVSPPAPVGASPDGMSTEVDASTGVEASAAPSTTGASGASVFVPPPVTGAGLDGAAPPVVGAVGASTLGALGASTDEGVLGASGEPAEGTSTPGEVVFAPPPLPVDGALGRVPPPVGRAAPPMSEPITPEAIGSKVDMSPWTAAWTTPSVSPSIAPSPTPTAAFDATRETPVRALMRRTWAPPSPKRPAMPPPANEPRPTANRLCACSGPRIWLTAAWTVTVATALCVPSARARSSSFAASAFMRVRATSFCTSWAILITQRMTVVAIFATTAGAARPPVATESSAPRPRSSAISAAIWPRNQPISSHIASTACFCFVQKSLRLSGPSAAFAMSRSFWTTRSREVRMSFA
ncbi:hypothetical protein ELQ90_04040 [Labedella phragmitis]|uniref:Uncharacterized protein n=1 Tax=Labedella phragmitis TaxID=2498849 RepID=A0A444PYY6_9MICO|nr:hypothetical protein [Labedella phragmitis]RWZ53102.1 hypothetical protein ELQ90_04040 [Labedella phragmitis]